MEEIDAPSGGYTTGSLATAAGYSVQQVRDLERLGVIPPAQRGANGYRRFGSRHLAALRAYRDVATAVGPVVARDAMRDAQTLPQDEAVARIVVLHVGLARSRERTLAALRALDGILRENAIEAEPTPADVMTITELAEAIGVRSSALRFWEQEGLLLPERATGLGIRRYPLAAIRDARIIAALRAGGYRIPAVREVLESIRDFDDAAAAREALAARLRSIAERSSALLRAGTGIADLIASR
ncbi:putative MerR family transcriptional regulator [Gordonia araii NBRC 100433]|uniref:Putative MerR family transcriptional regulator n=1 Tax=Gordonia araii NBRC 100433 TaxID=1073574 RepID=G7H6B1_9ACTN|nr:MerR family transcriptional regulator [Gordonia araii]NNG96067.1 MerR family transcriptional regulator [Gordonia araii NBRC 100433]GAB11386.1 putative MerR family transcriptional regulator [Gordonia araii NBRC 100433]